MYLVPVQVTFGTEPIGFPSELDSQSLMGVLASLLLAGSLPRSETWLERRSSNTKAAGYELGVGKMYD